MRNQKLLDKGIVATKVGEEWHCLLCDEESDIPTGMVIHVSHVHGDFPGQFGLVAKNVVDLKKVARLSPSE